MQKPHTYPHPHIQTSLAPQIINKKYSLRNKKQHNQKQQLRSHRFEETLPYEHQYVKQQYKWMEDREYLMGEESSFNCINTVQKVLDFNNMTSVNYTNHPTRTLSTTPSSQTPFIHQSPQIQQRRGKIPSNQPSIEYVHQTVGINTYRKEEQRVHTESSQPNSQHSKRGQYYYQLNQSSENNQKLSLKRKNNRKVKKELYVCLNYEDLSSSLYTPSLEKINWHQEWFKKDVFCGNGSAVRAGCACVPQCKWVDKWTTMMNNEGFTPQMFGSKQWSDDEWESTLKQIEKDLLRTQPEHATFKNREFIDILREVLVGYAKLDAEVGYVQGMNFVAAAIIYHTRTAFQSLRILSFIMQKHNFRRLFIDNLTLSDKLSQQCLNYLKKAAYDLYTHLQQQSVQPQIFIRSWYFSMLGNFIPLQSIHFILEKYIQKQFIGLNELVTTLLIYLKPKLMRLQDNHLLVALSVQQLTKTAHVIDWCELTLRSQCLTLPFLL